MAALILGLGSATLLVGAVALLAGGVFVAASILANNVSLCSRRPSSEDAGGDLVGPGLLRATDLGFFGAGLLVGSTNGNEATFLIAALTGGIVVVLGVRAGSEERRQR